MGDFWSRVLGGVLLAALLWLSWEYYQIWFPKFRTVPGAVPFLGHLPQIGDVRYLWEKVSTWCEEYGPEPFVYQLGPQKILVLPTPELVQEIFKLRPFKLQRPKVLLDVLNSWAPAMLSSETTGGLWAKQRRVIAPAFNHSQLQSFLPQMQLVAERVCEAMAEHHGPQAVNALLPNAFIDLIGLLAFKVDFQCTKRFSQEAADIRTAVTMSMWRVALPVPIHRIPVVGTYLDGGQPAVDRLHRCMDRIIADARVSKLDASGTVLQKLLEENAKLEKGGETVFDQTLLRGNLLSLFTAGSETTATTCAWMLWSLAHHVEFQDAAAAEAAAFHLNPAGPVEEALKQLPRIRSLFWESLRRYGPVDQIMSEPRVAIEFQGRTIQPKEYWLSAPVAYLMDSPIAEKYGVANPQIFDPARWYDAETKSLKGIPDVVRLAFGGSPQVCPGRSLAEIEVATLVAHVLRRFEIGVAPDHAEPRPESAFSRVPNMDLRLSFEPRVAKRSAVD